MTVSKTGPAAVAAAGCALAAGLYFYSQSLADNAHLAQIVALLIAAISLYASGVIPGFITSLLIFFVALVAQLAPADVVFSGFASGGPWLLFSGIVIGVAARETQLGSLMANWLVTNSRLDFVRAILVLSTVSVFLAFLVPAVIPRILILMPLAMGIAEMLGYEPGSRGYSGIALAVANSSFFPPLSILTATLPSVVFAGGIEASYGHAPSYALFLLYHFPVTGLMRWLALIGLIVFFFRDPESLRPPGSIVTQLESPHWRLITILFVAVICWMTDFIHGIPPAAVGLGVAIALLMPRIGVLDHAVFLKQADLTPFIFVAGVISLGAIVTSSNFDELIGSALEPIFSSAPAGGFVTYLLIAMLSSLACMVLTIPAAPVLLVPLAEQLSSVSGFSLQATLMTEYLGMTNILLPYQAPPLLVALSLFSVSTGSQMKVLLFLFVFMLVGVIPLNYLWWTFLGLL